MPRQLVPRPRLLDAFTVWRDYRVMRIVAPAGFGKSTLAAMWLNSLADLPPPQRPLAAWLPLSATDTALDVFLKRLADALDAHFPRLHQIAALFAAGELALPQLAHVLHAEFRTAAQPLVLVLDDLHLVGSDPADPVPALLQELVDHDALGPHHVHFVLLSRIRPPLDLSRLQLDDRMRSFDVDDLIFDQQEFAAFARLSRLSELPADQLAYIERRAGGWAAGLQLIVQSLPTTRGFTPGAFDALQATSSADLWSYIENAIFNRVSSHLAFMVDTSLLPVLHSEFCAAVTGIPAAKCAAILEAIAASNTLVSRYAPSLQRERPGAHFRVHPVLRDFLQRRLIHSHDRTALNAMRRRAALDLLLHDSTSDADACLSTLDPDVDFAANIVQLASRTAILRSEILAVRRWINRLPDAVIHTRPQLAVDAAWCAFHLLDIRLRAHLTRAHASMAQGVHEELRAEVAVLEVLCALHIDDLPAANAALRTARALPHSPDGIAAGYMHSLRGYLIFEEVRTLDERRRDFRRGYEIFSRNGYLRGRIETLITEQWVCSSCFSTLDALVAADRAIHELITSKMESTTFGIYSHLYAAQNFYLLDRIPDAHRELERVLQLIQETGASNVSDYHARVRLQLCELADGAAKLADFDPIKDQAQWIRAFAHTSSAISAHTAYLRIVRDVRLGHLQRIAHTLAPFNITVAELDTANINSTWLAVLAGAVLSEQRDPLILERLTLLHLRCEQLSHHSWGLPTRVLCVLHLDALGRTEEALSELRVLLEEVERRQHVRIVLDFAPLLQPLLERVDTPFSAELLRTMPVSLSPAELRVLHLLAEDASISEVATALVVSINTVRTHQRGIYRKLRVHDREEALRVAREAGLLLRTADAG